MAIRPHYTRPCCVTPWTGHYRFSRGVKLTPCLAGRAARSATGAAMGLTRVTILSFIGALAHYATALPPRRPVIPASCGWLSRFVPWNVPRVCRGWPRGELLREEGWPPVRGGLPAALRTPPYGPAEFQRMSPASGDNAR